VIVGSLPTSDGTAATAQAGCLIVLNSQGKPVETFVGDGINVPWDMAALDLGNLAVLFVSNVLNGTAAANGATVNQGTVLRIVLVQGDSDGDNDNIGMPRQLGGTVVARGFAERTDPNALVIGPTGLALGVDGTLYVADIFPSRASARTLANRTAAIPFAAVRLGSTATGNTVSENGSLNGPLGLAMAVNGGDGNMVEVRPGGTQVATKNIDTTGAGARTLFGLAVKFDGSGVYFVNDGNNTLNLLH
jgi:hypothetical protein